MDKILHIRPEYAAFLGNFGVASKHRHGALVLLIGMSGPFQVHLADDTVVRCRSALIDAHIEHAVDCYDEHLAALYFETSSELGRRLQHTFLQEEPVAFDVVISNFFNKRIERRILAADLPSLLCKPLEYPEILLDSRIMNCLLLMQHNEFLDASQTEVANHIGLSASRLNHLFKQSVGVPFRHYKLWSRVSLFMHDFHSTANVTQSALNAGFSDASHLSNSYRKVFGITPTNVFSNLDEFVVTR